MIDKKETEQRNNHKDYYNKNQEKFQDIKYYILIYLILNIFNVYLKFLDSIFHY